MIRDWRHRRGPRARPRVRSPRATPTSLVEQAECGLQADPQPLGQAACGQHRLGSAPARSAAMCWRVSSWPACCAASVTVVN